MVVNRVQFQSGLSLPHFMELYGTEKKCEAELELMRWPDGFRCPRCDWQQYGFIHGRPHKRYQCRNCRHQATLIAGTIMEATKLPLATRFLAFYFVRRAKNGISSLALMRHLGVNYRAAWLIHNKIMQAMSEKEDDFVLRERVQVDDAGHPQHVKLATLTTFSFAAIADWAQDALAPGCEVISDGLACFRAVAEVGCFHQAVVVRGSHPDKLPEFRWINTVLSNLKTSFIGTFHSLRLKKYGNRYLGALSYRFNRRFNLKAMTDRVLQTACCCLARSERLPRSAELTT